MRTVGVEEELLLVDPGTGAPVAVAGSVLAASDGLEAELQQQQIEIGTRPCSTLTELAEQLRHWRSEAATAAEKVGARIVATGTSPVPVVPELTVKPRYRAMVEAFGLTTAEQLTCGCHVHVDVESAEEGAAVLDRIRVWLPVILALSANSPYWQGVDTGYASFRSQAWTRLPTAGPTDPFGSADSYRSEVERLLGTGIALDEGMIYFDARLSHHLPTVEIRIADVCLRRDDTLLVAALVRALVETAARDWRSGTPPLPVPTSVLRLATWRAGRSGLDGDLLDPVHGTPGPARRVVDDLLSHLRDALTDAGDHAVVTDLVAGLLARGTGALHQRRWVEENDNLGATVLRMAELTTS
ncbi:glutamate--cysteine ligase [Microlunatus aurantiacus]|uniref:Putative glutamate--cysteine ligase 2 n=1 Tax=Microlunatus aurantiacus TaxID=446786 RepID=A0ABP7D9P0_9ACTN